jgi:transposase InsO family protein
MDFVHDQLFDGTKIRALTIVDLLSRVSPAVGVRQSYRGHHVVETLERGAAEFGYPKTIRVDNGPEFISTELDLWAYLKRGDARLQPARQADRQRLHRIVQRQVQDRMPERELVSEPRRSAGKMRGLA